MLGDWRYDEQDAMPSAHSIEGPKPMHPLSGKWHSDRTDLKKLTLTLKYALSQSLSPPPNHDDPAPKKADACEAPRAIDPFPAMCEFATAL